MIKSIKTIVFIFVFTFGFGLISSCSNDSANPVPLPPIPQLDISVYQGDVEAILGTNVKIAGYLINVNQDTLHSEMIYFSSEPDSIGNLSPLGGVLTDVTKPTGLSSDVIFFGRKLGKVTITGIYRDSQGNVATTDTIGLLIINPNG